MTKDGFLKSHKEMCDKMVSLVQAKNHDYAGKGDDPFANFKLSEEMGIVNTETAIVVRMLDKFGRIKSFLNRGVCKVKDESVIDTLVDLANYSIILASYIKDKTEKEEDGVKTDGNSSNVILQDNPIDEEYLMFLGFKKTPYNDYIPPYPANEDTYLLEYKATIFQNNEPIKGSEEWRAITRNPDYIFIKNFETLGELRDFHKGMCGGTLF